MLQAADAFDQCTAVVDKTVQEKTAWEVEARENGRERAQQNSGVPATTAFT